MAIEVACPQCGKRLRVRPEYAGQSMLCPSCSATITVPSGRPAADRETRHPAARRRAPRRRRDPEDEDDRDYDSGYAPCPKCGGREARRVTFTFWGSFYGPALLTHVRCPECGTAYNGKTGRSNLPWVIGCVTAPLLMIAG